MTPSPAATPGRRSASSACAPSSRRCSIPWLGAHVLYLEEFLEDDPDIRADSCCCSSSRRDDARHAVHVHLLSFAEPRAVDAPELSSGARRLARVARRARLRRLRFHPDCAPASSFAAAPSVTSACDDSSGTLRYLDYQLLIGADLYWYRRRALPRAATGSCSRRSIGFNRFEPNEAQLYACRIAYSASGARARPAGRC